MFFVELILLQWSFLCIKNLGRLQGWNTGPPVQETEMIPLSYRDTCNRGVPYTEPNLCLSDFSDYLNSLNSMKVLLHLDKPQFL